MAIFSAIVAHLIICGRKALFFSLVTNKHPLRMSRFVVCIVIFFCFFSAFFPGRIANLVHPILILNLATLPIGNVLSEPLIQVEERTG